MLPAIVPIALLGGTALLLVTAKRSQPPPNEGPPAAGPPSGGPPTWTPPLLPPMALPGSPPGQGLPPLAWPPTTPPATPPMTDGGPPGGMSQSQLDAVTIRDPVTGIRVFQRTVAQSIARQLASLRQIPTQDPTLLELASAPVVAATESGLAWALAQNVTNTIVAPIYMAFPSTARKFLRAVVSGQDEEKFCRDGQMYAILAPPAQLPLLLAGMSGLPPVLMTPPALMTPPTAAPPLVPVPLPPLGSPPVSLPPLGSPPVSTPPSVPPTTPPGTGSGDLDDLPEPLRTSINLLLTSPSADPDGMDVAAKAIESSGFAKVAARLRARANELRAAAAKHPAPPPPPTPLKPPAPPVSQIVRVLKSGETAWGLANEYTGDGNRWRELLPVNPTLKEIAGTTTDGKKTVFLNPWRVGQTVKIPPAWASTPRSAAPQAAKSTLKVSGTPAEQVAGGDTTGDASHE